MKLLTGIGTAVCAAVVAALVFCLGMLALPLVVFFGWVAGHFLCFFAGAFIASALTSFLSLFGLTAVVTVEMVPMITACLAFIGYFFKAKQTNNNNKD